MRIKEESEDYRYFQEPDLLPLFIDDEWRARALESQPELPAERRTRYRNLGADARTAAALADAADLALLFEAAVAGGADARVVGLWLTGEVVAYLRRGDREIRDTALEADHLVELQTMVDAGTLSATAAKEVLVAVLDGEGSPEDVAAAHDLVQISDEGAIETEVDAVIAANGDAFEKLRGGDMKPIGFLVGQVMRATGGRADPRLVQELLRRKAAE
jgi:aspartyl-tRNA(Asn)/glutamyl-tRNA(Gln) amidotransferase subunit B